jgi:hypothetical protein
VFQFRDILDAEMKDGCGQSRVCATFVKDFDEVAR